MERKNFLFLSLDAALIGDLAWQVSKEGHDVKYYIEAESDRDFGAGIDHVRKNPAPYMIKPLGKVQNVKRLLYVGRDDDGGDVVDVLRAYETAWGDRMKGFQLQRRVSGVEVAVCGFFDGNRFVR